MFWECKFIWNKFIWFAVTSLGYSFGSVSHKPVTGNGPSSLGAAKRSPSVYNVAMYHNAVVCLSLYNAERSCLSSHIFLLSIYPSIRPLVCLPVQPFQPAPLPSDNNNDNINITHGQFLPLHPYRQFHPILPLSMLYHVSIICNHSSKHDSTYILGGITSALWYFPSQMANAK